MEDKERRLSWTPPGLSPLGPGTGEGQDVDCISGDGTQLAVMGFTTDRSSRGVLGLAVSAALLNGMAGPGEKVVVGWRELMAVWGGKMVGVY